MPEKVTIDTDDDEIKLLIAGREVEPENIRWRIMEPPENRSDEDGYTAIELDLVSN